MEKVVLRLKGGLGNQLFQYAFARKIALFHNARLIIDCKSGFSRDFKYRRVFELHHFNIIIDATGGSFMYLLRMQISKFLKRFNLHFYDYYLSDDSMEYNSKYLAVNTRGILFIDGYFQSYRYFQDIAAILSRDLSFINSSLHFSTELFNKNSVAIHFRYFTPIDSKLNSENLDLSYYENSISFLLNKNRDFKFFVFSDDISSVSELDLFKQLPNVQFMSNNAIYDFAMMSKCKNIIIANSTFSWWAAWLNSFDKEFIICPDIAFSGDTTSWGFDGLIPDNWIKII